MTKIRIYELARELGIDNKAVVQLAQKLGIPGKSSHSHSLEDEEAEQIRRAVIRSALGSAPEETETVERDGENVRVTIRRKGNIIRRRRKGGASEEPAKESLDGGQDTQSVAPQSDQPTLQDQAPAAQEQESSELQTTDSVSESQEPSASELQADSQELADAQGAQEQVEAAPETDSGDSDQGKSDQDAPGVGPKILGKIQLAQSSARKSSSSSQRGGAKAGAGGAAGRNTGFGMFGAPGFDERGGKGRDGKKRSVKQKRSKVREFSRSDLDYEGGASRRVKRKPKSSKAASSTESAQNIEAMKPKASKRVIRVDEAITVGELAKQMSLKSAEIIKKLIDLGVMATINQMIDIETATIVAEEFDYKVESSSFDETQALAAQSSDEANLVTRAPIVTVMGHVDHGKTSLLDSIRSASVAAREHGGITQHIGAYQVELENGSSVSFIDTPGHEAFTSMRARGAQITDLVILVVAADDGVMPQTIEAINHAKAAEVPIVVAVNKMDKAGANPDKVRQQLAERGLQPEDWGGDTMYFPVSALNGDGIKELLEGVLLQAEVLELKADPTTRAKGTIVESQQDSRKGIVATVLVQNGTLKIGDAFVVGAQSGRIRSMVDHNGIKVEEAGPAMPVEISGLSGVPEAGDDFHVVENDSIARELAERRSEIKSKRDQVNSGGGPISLEEFAKQASSASAQELPIILKADVHGSSEAVKASLERLSGAKVKVNVIHSSVGAISESDIKLAMASKAIIVGFNVRAEPRAAREAEAAGIEIRFYNIIYDLTEDIKSAMVGLLEPDKKEISIGSAEVRETFVVPKIGTIAGSYITDGQAKRGAHVRLVRDGVQIYEGEMSSLRRFKDDVKEVQSGYECGIGITNYNDIKVGDVIELFDYEEVAPTLE